MQSQKTENITSLYTQKKTKREHEAVEETALANKKGTRRKEQSVPT